MELTTQAECDALQVGDLIRRDGGGRNTAIFIVVEKQGSQSLIISLGGLCHAPLRPSPFVINSTEKVTTVAPTDPDFLRYIDLLKNQTFNWTPDGAIATAIGWDQFPK